MQEDNAHTFRLVEICPTLIGAFQAYLSLLTKTLGARNVSESDT